MPTTRRMTRSATRTTTRSTSTTPVLKPETFISPTHPNEFIRPSPPTEFIRPDTPEEFTRPHYPPNLVLNGPGNGPDRPGVVKTIKTPRHVTRNNFNFGSPPRNEPNYVGYSNQPISEILTGALEAVRGIPISEDEREHINTALSDSDDSNDSDVTAPSSVAPERYSTFKSRTVRYRAARPGPRPMKAVIGVTTVVEENPTSSKQEQVHDPSPSPSMADRTSTPPTGNYQDAYQRTNSDTSTPPNGNPQGAYKWNNSVILCLLLSLGVLAINLIGGGSIMRGEKVPPGEMYDHIPLGGDNVQQNLYDRLQHATTVLERSNEQAKKVMERLDNAMDTAEHVTQDASKAHQDAINARRALNDATAELEKAKASWEERFNLNKKMLTEEKTLHDNSIQHLDKILPDKLVVTKAPGGRIKIEDSFWIALKAKIDEDYGRTGPSQGKQSHWQEYLAHTERLVEKKVDERFKQKHKSEWAQAIEEEVILTRSEFLDLLNNKYKEFSGEADDIRTNFGSQLRQLDSSISDRVNEAIMERYNHIAREDVMKSIAPSQLEAMAHIAILANAWSALTRINWLTPALGAVVDPNGTSITYDPNPRTASRRWFGFGFARHAPEITRFPRVNAPVTALLPWNELDDCWCTPMTAESTLDVHLGRSIYPSDMSIEHVPASSTPDIEAAPRKIQVWGRIHDKHNTNKKVAAVAWKELRQLFPRLVKQARNQRDASRGWSPLAEFQYDIRHINHVQTFAFPFDAEHVNAPVSRIRLKLIDNWGSKTRVCLYRVRLHGSDVSNNVLEGDSTEDGR
ncbi:MAG: hypothetical protein M1816_005642 [Peltula sp. TS41687]|nr:MAG: hypothetical protein M1816_005642 [Peltula sp. TS41687]